MLITYFRLTLLDHAGCFFRVLSIYPDPIKLLAVLGNDIPPVFNGIQMVSEVSGGEVTSRLRRVSGISLEAGVSSSLF
jgi:hypothetical protein